MASVVLFLCHHDQGILLDYFSLFISRSSSFYPLWFTLVPPFFNLHSHSISILSLSSVWDESRPMVPFTSPEEAPLRWLIRCFPLLLTDRHDAHRQRTRADQHSCLPVSLCTCAYASYKHMQRWIIRGTALQTCIWCAWRHSSSGGKSKGMALWYEMPDVRSPRVVTWLCDVWLLDSAQQCLLVCSVGGREGGHARDSFY